MDRFLSVAFLTAAFGQAHISFGQNSPVPEINRDIFVLIDPLTVVPASLDLPAVTECEERKTNILTLINCKTPGATFSLQRGDAIVTAEIEKVSHQITTMSDGRLVEVSYYMGQYPVLKKNLPFTFTVKMMHGYLNSGNLRINQDQNFSVIFQLPPEDKPESF